MELAVVGEDEFVTGFRLAGIKKVYETKSGEELETIVEGLAENPDIGILVMHSDDFNKLPETLRDNLSESVEPTLVTLGGTSQSSNIRDKIKQAVGVDLWK
jgi:V/A-type H+-transporting ATPase subunit F